MNKIQKASEILPIISVDLIFNFPNQKKDELLNDIAMSKNTNATQITFYPLMKSNLTEDKILHSLGYSPKDNQREFYEIICANMQEFCMNNVWSFTKNTNNTIKDEYVSSYSNYLGAGSGAFSFLENKLFINAFDLNQMHNFAKKMVLISLQVANLAKKILCIICF